MKKIGVCACYNTKNYGSMLQSLATGKMLEKLGYPYEFIRYKRKPTVGLILKSLDRIPEIVKGKRLKVERQRALSKYPNVDSGIKRRNACFDSFMNQTFTNMSPAYDTFEQLTQAARGYDAVMVGSDQLWRPEGYSTGFYNLMFVPDEVTKIAYATSFGVSQIPKRKKKIAKTFLNRIEHISVRELRASEMIKELIGRDVPTVVDPTLLFTGDEWKKIIPSKTVVDEKYMFCYLLGNNPLHRMWVKELGQQTGYKIVTIPHLDEFVESDITFGDYQLYDVGPAEFVNLIRNAEYVCTDSFHGTVFSILNYKQFVTFNRFADESRNSRNSRIESLLSQTGLEKRRMTMKEQSIVNLALAEIDYECVDTKLNQMRNRSVEYLSSALECV
ncbi:MAG TPA: polysaccharide pyruvyl transferase family protein [Candidatus Cottocaccamicrobium excrementipullorum]|nr:polysaccharide pyruvyl transferase family protein [Candidatus Cottocaccamicrobium excrementipullorum]